MASYESSRPIYELHIDDRIIAKLSEPQLEDMFWWSYRVTPITMESDRIIHDRKTWEAVNFTIKDLSGNIVNPHTLSGGYERFCDHQTDRLSFRSLGPPRLDRNKQWKRWEATKQFLKRLKQRLKKPYNCLIS